MTQWEIGYNHYDSEANVSSFLAGLRLVLDSKDISLPSYSFDSAAIPTDDGQRRHQCTLL